ncbi:concanavalin A-like lectin/glucanase superfamily protein [Nitrospirillum amazonense]|uniref:Concanavalin A-like lectin/glucanase superfamily protein n=1 Tax=Nitrospirillum amazonense TaxID=28077 RepID=A0A560KAY5_9PROT|nr:LamG-like jellyroll fold domain-containing protein [Nitrospirillum amazonense]TWB80356.1 concanavalin A-like lectin/glucanase superfamily protein [Nitrospirillum amazonense]
MSGMTKASRALAACLLSTTILPLPVRAAAEAGGLLFRVSADSGFVADVAGGQAVPNFQDKVKIVPTGVSGGAIEWPDDGVLAWDAPGNIYAQRGTLSFFWRSRYPMGVAPFVIFRVGFADHTSWDMAWLRIDWNGHGFDAFVTDANLARTRVSFTLDTPPAPDAWTHIAFAWDETTGVRLYLNGKEVARQDAKGDYDVGLDQFGLAGRTISPHQVQSRYSFMRGGDVDEIRIYDHMLAPADMAALARNEMLGAAPGPGPDAATRQAWLHRYGWEDKAPPLLTAPVTAIRKVEFADAKDKKEWMWKATDGISETTWPGVYNRSRLPGRNDYFTLPDWNTYVEGGQALDLALPDEPFNRVEIRGAAYGSLDYAGADGAFRPLAKRRQGPVRTVDQFDSRRGGRLRFTNVAQETPIQEIWAYNVTEGAEPQGTMKLSYTIRADAAPDYDNLAALRGYIAGRYPANERSTVVALPNEAPVRKRAAEAGASMPIVHVLIPSGFGDPPVAQPLMRAWAYGWENMHDGLDGIAIDLPALSVAPGKDGLIPLNIQVKDPIWPDRDLIDVSVSVKPGQARTLWLDTRDRILTNDSLYLTVASAAPDFTAHSLDGARIRLVFKDREQAKVEHIADRLNQVKDNWGFLVEEHTTSKRQRLYRRLFGDVSDLLRVDPDNLLGRYYWADMSYGAQGWPAFAQPQAPAGVPLWAFRQVEDMKLVRRFVDWWIDERQVPYGDFGGGISDDTDLTEQWPGLALMGVEPDKINASLRALIDAQYRNGMITNGLGTIATDELHSYEEGINSNSEALYLNWGEPRTVERLMATTKALAERIILPNPNGHVHFATNWFSGTQAYREGPWEWQKPHSFMITHPAILMGIYNANPKARALIQGLADGYLAHGKPGGKDGTLSFPAEINWRTDAERDGDLAKAVGEVGAMQTFWASYRWTGDAKYLSPILSRVAQAGPRAIDELNENAIDVLGRRDDWGKAMTAKADKAGPATLRGDSGFAPYIAWQMTGDKRWLEELHAAAIQSKSQTMYMNTEGHWWSDRVDLPNDVLQRERLGGVALRRNYLYPGHTVSWRFAEPDGAEQVAILLPGATRDHFKVVAYNLSDRPQAARMTTWNVTAGHWRMVSGAATGEGDAITGEATTKAVDLERSAGVDLVFQPHQTTVLEFTLDQATTPVETRPDLGIGRDDVRVEKGVLHATVHSLGGAAAPAGILSLVDASGTVVATAPVPALAAPLDLVPRTAEVTLPLPKSFKAQGATVRVGLDQPELTLANNVVSLP